VLRARGEVLSIETICYPAVTSINELSSLGGIGNASEPHDPLQACTMRLRSDGQRVLVDRLWPRNKRKEDLHGQWLREVAPSDELRKAFHAGDAGFRRIHPALPAGTGRAPRALVPAAGHGGKGELTLLYAGKDTEHNNARVLADWLEDELERRGPGSSPVCYAR
jgi:uncharacterized protein YeaO (DUF488 family)